MRKLAYLAAAALAAGAALLAAIPSESSPAATSGARPQDDESRDASALPDQPHSATVDALHNLVVRTRLR